jgi:hypothetical protein
MVIDIEDLVNRVRLSHVPTSETSPLAVEVTLYRGDSFVDDREVDRQLALLSSQYQRDQQYV